MERPQVAPGIVRRSVAMHGVEFRGEPTKRGPITSIMNGLGVRPWLPQLILEPGWIYVVTRLMTLSTPPGQPRRCCWRCVPDLLEACDGHASVDWEEAPPAADERCPRCERSYGERPKALRP